MPRLRPPRFWTRLNFSVKFVFIMAVAAVLIAIIPLSLASRENSVQATQRAGDKSGIVVNLITGQQHSLAAFAAGMAEELGPALAAGDAASLEATLARYSTVNQPSDVIGVRGSAATIAVRAARPLAAGDPLSAALGSPGAATGPVVAGPNGEPWLVATSTVPGSSESAYIARPVDAAFIAALDGTIATSADPASIAVVRGGRVAAPGSELLGRPLAAGTIVTGSPAALLGSPGTADVVDVGGLQAGASARPLSAGYVVLVSTPVSAATTFWQPVALLLVLIVVAMIFIVLVVQTDLQRPLRRLDRAVAALARDEYDVPIPHVATHEIGRLAASFEEMRRQLRATIAATRARAAIATELNSPQPLETALREVCVQLRSSTSAGSAFILVARSEMTDSFSVSDGEATGGDVDTLLTEEGPIGAAYRHLGTEALMVSASPRSTEGTTGFRNYCVAPLRIGRTVLGVTGVALRGSDFTASDATLVSSAAEQVALALERYRFIAVMQRQASIDDLTGLYNHRFLVDYLGQQVALAERLNTPLAVLVIDLDHFKRVNDTHGHPAGDAVLTAFAETLSGSIRRADLAARYGGEEFIVVMSNTAAADALVVAEKIRLAAAAMSVPIGSDATVTVTVSIGGAAYPEDTTSAAELLATADSALYDAKHAGRNRVCMAA